MKQCALAWLEGRTAWAGIIAAAIIGAPLAILFTVLFFAAFVVLALIGGVVWLYQRRALVGMLFADIWRNGIRSEFHQALALGAAVLFIVLVSMPAWAQSSGDVVKKAYDYGCANEAMLLPWLEWFAGIIGGSKVFSWLLRAVDRFVVSVPKPMLQIADTFAMNWVQSTLAKGPPQAASKAS